MATFKTSAGGFVTGAEIANFLRQVVTEERTDAVIGFVVSRVGPRLPWWFPSALVRVVLDYILPDILLEAIERLLVKDNKTGA